MQPASETTLSTLPGSVETERVLMVLVQRPNENSHIELRQQSYAAGLGWFNQSTVSLDPSQVAALRQALGSGQKKTSAGELPASFRRVAASDAWQPRIVHADSA